MLSPFLELAPWGGRNLTQKKECRSNSPATWTVPRRCGIVRDRGVATFWEGTFERRVEFEKDPATRTDGDVGEGVRGGGGDVRAEAPVGTGLACSKNITGASVSGASG